MDVFGLTPVDSALSAWGLNVAQVLTETFFIHTKLGVLAFTVGFFWSIWESIKKDNLKSFLVFVFICLSGIILLVIPQQEEPVFKSQMEETETNLISAKALKEAQTSLRNIPTVLSFIAYGADTIVLDAIKVMDQSLNPKKRFLTNPFGIQKLSLEVNQVIYAPIREEDLNDQVDRFIYADYLPSLIMNDSDAHAFEGQDALKERLLSSPGFHLDKVDNFLEEMGSAPELVHEKILSSIILGQMHQQTRSFIWPLSLTIYVLFPFVLGWANFLLYAAFPVVMLLLIIFRRLAIFLRYLEFFVWIKSWVLTAAVAHYVSLIAAYMQAQQSAEPNWFWQYPYYAVICAALLLLMPALSLIGIHKGLQSINHRN